MDAYARFGPIVSRSPYRDPAPSQCDPSLADAARRAGPERELLFPYAIAWLCCLARVVAGCERGDVVCGGMALAGALVFVLPYLLFVRGDIKGS